MPNSFYGPSKPDIEAHFLPQFQTLNPQPCYSNFNNSKDISKLSSAQYSTLESSSASGSYNPSCVSFSANESPPMSHIDFLSYPSGQHNSPEIGCSSPVSGSTITDDKNDLKHKLRELETVMLGPDSDVVTSSYGSAFGGRTHVALPEMESWGVMEIIAQRNLRQVLIACGKAVSDNDQLLTQWLIDELRQMVSVSGEPVQRLGAYMLEGLVARQASSGSSIYNALKCKEPASSDLLSYMHLLYEVCPYIKFGYMSANGAIAEAMKDENRVHIIDFHIGQGSQWVTLIQAFAARPGGPPHIRITGIDDSYSEYARGGGLNIVGKRLSELADWFNVPFEFHAASISGHYIQCEDLGIRPEESLAVNFAFVLHHMPDESVSTENHRDRLLRLVKSLSPKVVTLVEQECNTNSAAFFPRFLETLNYYTAMFESIDMTLPRDNKDRINVEQHCLARDIVNLIACEGAERVERHELLGKWRLRFKMAGFMPYPLSSLVNTTIKTLLKNYPNKYTLDEKDGALYLGWMDRNLVASCAWQCS
uniref:GRAS10 n=1 Tax=Tamarix hispida TaxID=189793 RepID=A0A2S1WLP6_9CARY|nr:GRAS10 [Tamarix hispida]